MQKAVTQRLFKGMYQSQKKRYIVFTIILMVCVIHFGQLSHYSPETKEFGSMMEPLKPFRNLSKMKVYSILNTVLCYKRIY